MSCATLTIKYLVFIFNTLCALLGIGSIVANALALKTVTDDGRLVCIFMIVLGSIVFLISFFGCCGAIRESTCLLWTYAAFLIILIVANAVIMFGYISNINGVKHAHKDIDMAWSLQLNGTDAMSPMQTALGCCGKQGSQDYINANMTIPDSCYLHGNKTEPNNLYQAGCLYKLMEIYGGAERLVVIFSWTSLTVEFMALVCACILAITFRNQQRRSRY